MKISIVTVCLNVEDSIEQTIRSVINQTYKDFEYIIQDGGSTDRTLEIVEKYREQYNIKVHSEKDTGLYNAMNRSIKYALGEYILFLNSKDVFYDDNVLANIAPYLRADIVMGNVIRIKKEGRFTEKYGNRMYVFGMLMSGRMPCHQVIFSQRKLLEKIDGFQEKYSICADFDFLVRCCRKKVSMEWIDVSVSVVDSITGISSQHENLNEMRWQDDMSIKNNYYLLYQLMRPVKFIKRSLGRV